MTHTNRHPQDYVRTYPIISQLIRLCVGCGGHISPDLHTDVLKCLNCNGTEWEWIQESEAADYRNAIRNDPAWKMGNLKFYIIDINHKRVFDGSYYECANELDRLIHSEDGYWYLYDEADPNEAWQSGGNADAEVEQ